MASRILGVWTNADHPKLTPSSFGAVTEGSFNFFGTTPTHDAAVSSHGIIIPPGSWARLDFHQPGVAMTADQAVAGETVFCHAFRANFLAPDASVHQMTLLDAAGYEWVALRTDAARNLIFAVNTGTGAAPVWTNITAAFGFTTWATIDIKCKLVAGGAHVVELAYNNTSAGGPIAFNQALFTNVASIKLYGNTNNSGGESASWSQVNATVGYSTIGSVVKTAAPTGAGTYAEMTGTYADVDDGPLNDADANTTATNGTRQSYDFANVTLPTGYNLAAVQLNLRAKNSGSAPTNLEGLFRSGGVDTYSGNLSGMGTSYAGLLWRTDANDPAGAALNLATINAANWGFRAAA